MRAGARPNPGRRFLSWCWCWLWRRWPMASAVRSCCATVSRAYMRETSESQRPRSSLKLLFGLDSRRARAARRTHSPALAHWPLIVLTPPPSLSHRPLEPPGGHPARASEASEGEAGEAKGTAPASTARPLSCPSWPSGPLGGLEGPRRCGAVACEGLASGLGVPFEITFATFWSRMEIEVFDVASEFFTVADRVMERVWVPLA